jgi:hypothetical protein
VVCIKLAAQAWYAEFLLEIDLKVLLTKTGSRLIFKIALKSLHIDPELCLSIQPWRHIPQANSKLSAFT